MTVCRLCPTTKNSEFATPAKWHIRMYANPYNGTENFLLSVCNEHLSVAAQLAQLAQNVSFAMDEIKETK